MKPIYEAPLTENVRLEARANGTILLTLTTTMETHPAQAALKSVQHCLLLPDMAEKLAASLAEEESRAREQFRQRHAEAAAGPGGRKTR